MFLPQMNVNRKVHFLLFNITLNDDLLSERYEYFPYVNKQCLGLSVWLVTTVVYRLGYLHKECLEYCGYASSKASDVVPSTTVAIIYTEFVVDNVV